MTHKPHSLRPAVETDLDALLEIFNTHAFVNFYDAGLRRAILGVDATSLKGATRLYEKAGMYVERQTNVYALTIRDGVDMMITDLET